MTLSFLGTFSLQKQQDSQKHNIIIGNNCASKAESDNKSPFPNSIEYPQLEIGYSQLGIVYPIRYFRLLVLY